MENRGGQRRELKGCGITDSAYTMIIPLKTFLSFIHIIPTNPEGPCYMSPVTPFFSISQSIGIL